MSGFIKLHRCLEQNKVLKNDLELLGFFTRLLLKATHIDRQKSYRGITVSIKRGQFWSNERALAEECGITRGKLRRMKKTLENAEMVSFRPIHITWKTDPLGTLITINNYDKFQGDSKMTDPHNLQNRPDHKKRINSTQSVLDPVEKKPTPELEKSGVEKLVAVFNEVKPEIFPPVDIKRLHQRVIAMAAMALAVEPCLEEWKKAVVKMGESSWHTGVELRNGKPFDKTTAFEFLVWKHKTKVWNRRALLDGDYRPSQCLTKLPAGRLEGAGFFVRREELSDAEKSALAQFNQFQEQVNAPTPPARMDCCLEERRKLKAQWGIL